MRKSTKRVITALLVLLLCLSTVSSAFAATDDGTKVGIGSTGVDSDALDDGSPVSLTIYKYESTVDLEKLVPSSGTKRDGDTYVYTDEKGKSVTLSDLNPLEGVTFTVTQVKRDPDGSILITNASGSPYTYDMYGNQIKDEDYTNTYSKVGGGLVAEVTTNKNGEAVFSASSTNGLTGKAIGEIPHGLYLVTENYCPAVAKAVAPFIVALPMTVRDGDQKDGELPRSTLLYNVYAYPKNQIPLQPKIEKYVTQINGISDTVGASTNTLNSYYDTASDSDATARNEANDNVNRSYVEDAQTHVDDEINSASDAAIKDNVAVGSKNTANASEVNEAKGVNALAATEKDREYGQPSRSRNNEVQYILECGVPYDMLDCGKYVIEDDLEYRLIFDECSLQFKIATAWDKKTGVPTAYQELELKKGTSFTEGDANYGDYVITIDTVDTKGCDYSKDGEKETKVVIQLTKSGRLKVYNALYPASDAKSATNSWIPYTDNYTKAVANNTAQTMNLTYDNYKYANASYFDYKNLYIFFNCALNTDAIEHTTKGVSIDNTAELRYTSYFGYQYGDDDDDGYDDHEDKEVKVTKDKSKTQTVTVWYTGLEMVKIDGVDSNIKLANAKFKVYANKDDAKAGINELTASENGVEKTVFTSDENGVLRIAGLAYSDQVTTSKEYTEKSYDEDGNLVDQKVTKNVYTIDQEKSRDYWLVEVEAPDGYELWKNPIKVTVGYQDYMTYVTGSTSWDLASLLQFQTSGTNYIKNYTIELLPGTGLTSSNLVLIGLAIVVIAVALIVLVLVKNKKKKNNKDQNDKKDDLNNPDPDNKGNLEV